MEAPEKVYFGYSDDGYEDWALQPFENSNNIEYIRSDLAELTWEDILIIWNIMFEYNAKIRKEQIVPIDKDYCEEVLRRFQDNKKHKKN